MFGIQRKQNNRAPINHGIPVCGEQDHGKDPWGGILSTYGAVLAMYTAAIALDEYKSLALQGVSQF